MERYAKVGKSTAYGERAMTLLTIRSSRTAISSLDDRTPKEGSILVTKSAKVTTA